MSDTIGTKSGRGKRGLAILVLMIGVSTVLYYAWSWNHYYRQAPERTGKDMVFMWHWKMYADGMKVAYTQDTYGGATPEETLQLFIDALKAGDIDLASKYYIPEKQGEVLHELVTGKKNDGLTRLVEIYSKASMGKLSGDDKYFMTVADGEYSFDFIFMKNKISNKWKISAP